MHRRILITGPALAREATEEAERRGARLIALRPYSSPDEIAATAKAEQVDGIIVRQGQLTDAVLGASPRLRVVAKHGVGYDNIDVSAATRRGIPVFIARGGNSQSVAEQAFALMFAVARGTSQLDARTKAGHWDKATYTGTELFGRSLGIVGLGEIGRILVELVQPLRMAVRVFDPYLPSHAEVRGAERAPTLDALLEGSDVVSLHCPLTPETRHLMGAAQFSRMREGSILINTARGGLVDEAALIEAVKAGRIAGAGLDTFEQEPPPADSPLIALPNVVATPTSARIRRPPRIASVSSRCSTCSACSTGRHPTCARSSTGTRSPPPRSQSRTTPYLRRKR